MQVFSSSHRHFLTLILLLTGSAAAEKRACTIIHAKPPSPAEKAYLDGDFDHAAQLYQEQLQKTPNDTNVAVGLVHALLRQEKISEADDLVQKSLTANPKSVELITAQAEVQYREGKPWLAAETVNSAFQLDTCNPQVHLLMGRLLRLNSYYESALMEINTAHTLSPDDPSIRLYWLETLPRPKRITELEGYLATPTGNDADFIKNLHLYLDDLKKRADLPHKACRLVSDTSSTSIPFTPLMEEGMNIRAWGLNVKLNNRSAHLEIDTGASGIVISRSVANHAGLQPVSKEVIGGIGDKGAKAGYTAFAESIKIGTLEFHDCEVDVIDKDNILESDGLIGMDVFSHFLVTLDYPMRKVLLDPLPPRPGESAHAKPTLETETSLSDDDDNDDDGPSADKQKTTPKVHDRYIAPEMKTWTPIYRVGHDLLLPASLNDSKVKLFILDTGAFTTTISPAVAREVTKVHSNGDLIVEGISGKVDKVYAANEITFKFANLSQKVRDVVAFDSPKVSKSIGMDVSGFIGFTTLGQTTMKIDYRDGLVSFSYDANRGYKF